MTLYFVGFDGGSVNIAHLDETLDEGIIKEKILAAVDEHSQRLNRITRGMGECEHLCLFHVSTHKRGHLWSFIWQSTIMEENRSA